MWKETGSGVEDVVWWWVDDDDNEKISLSGVGWGRNKI